MAVKCPHCGEKENLRNKVILDVYFDIDKDKHIHIVDKIDVNAIKNGKPIMICDSCGMTTRLNMH